MNVGMHVSSPYESLGFFKYILGSEIAGSFVVSRYIAFILKSILSGARIWKQCL